MGYTTPKSMGAVHKIIAKRPDIEKGIPMPSWGKPTFFDYPYDEMEIGDSFKIPHTEASNILISSRVHSWMRGPKNTAGFRFACRKGTDDDGQGYTRVWRVEPDPDVALYASIISKEKEKS